MAATAVWPGGSYPLGATYDGAGTNFALFSEVAERVELCLFGDDGTETRIDLHEVDGFVWHSDCELIKEPMPSEPGILTGASGPKTANVAIRLPHARWRLPSAA